MFASSAGVPTIEIISETLDSPLIDGIILVQKMCIYSCVTLSTTLLITRGPV